MTSPFEIFMQATNAKIASRVDVPPRAERREPLPAHYARGKMGAWLTAMVGSAESLWRHQSLSLAAIAAGENIVVSTGTASGKSLIFQAAAIDAILAKGQSSLVMYPLKALTSDQLVRWEQALQRAGISPSKVGEITGDIDMVERDRVLAECQIILATPDVIHSWLMRQVSSPSVQAFLARLKLLVLDEAHAFNAVFGSSSAFFFRRLRSAHETVQAATKDGCGSLQIIAATATLHDAAEHLNRLTGCDFVWIDESENGAPFHGLTLLHVEGPANGTPAERMMADNARALAEVIHPHALIGFADSRQGVEKVTEAIGRDNVLPYRSGYHAHDRRSIEKALRDGNLVGVISTSALELGIDIPQFQIGLNLGVPQSRKALRQRVGRIGRAGAGVFAVQAPKSAFAQLGTTFREFFDGPVEPSHLYLGNRMIQFQQARCLLEECGHDEDTPRLPDNVEWPEGFEAMFRQALPGAVRDRDLDQISAIGMNGPHIAYPLRNISDVSYALKVIRRDGEIGTIGQDKALREAYPGATYRHFGKKYRVLDWRSTSYETSITLQPLKNGETTRPLLYTSVSVSVEPSEIIADRLKASKSGSVAEIHMRVTESVDGFTVGSAKFLYRELVAKNRCMKRKMREFTTTGVLLRIDEPWFNGPEEHHLAARHTVAKALRVILAQENNISPGDLRSAHYGISLYSVAGARKIEDAIVIFDATPGGLRLSAPLFTEFEAIVSRLKLAAELAGADALLNHDAADRLLSWWNTLATSACISEPLPPTATGEIIIFAPLSEVNVRVRGAVVERKLGAPKLIKCGEHEQLMYEYESGPGILSLVPHDIVEPSGHNWRHAAWNPASNEIRELAA